MILETTKSQNKELHKAFTELKFGLSQEKRVADSETEKHTAVYSPAQTYSPSVISIYATIVNYKSSGNSEVDIYPVWSFLLAGEIVSTEEHARQLRAVAASGFPNKFTCHYKWKFLLLT